MELQTHEAREKAGPSTLPGTELRGCRGIEGIEQAHGQKRRCSNGITSPAAVTKRTRLPSPRPEAMATCGLPLPEPLSSEQLKCCSVHSPRANCAPRADRPRLCNTHRSSYWE